MPDVTIYTLAEELNMSPSMVSRAFNPDARINEEKRKTVLRAAEKYNFSPNKFASRLSLKPVKIGVLLNSNFEVNTKKMLAGVDEAYSRLKDYKINYDITVLNHDIHKFEDYVSAIEKYKSYDGVCLAGFSAERYTPLVNELYKSNPNIAQVQATNRNVEFLIESRHNEEVASSLAAEFLGNCLRQSERKNVLLFTGNRESTLHAVAEKAFFAACKEHGMTVIDSIDMKDNEKYLSEILPSVFAKNKDTADAIYITSGFSLSLCRYLEENEISIPFVAFDVYDGIKKYMEKGIISAAISQNVTKQMETAFEKLARYIIAGEECEKTVFTDVQLVLKSNIHQFE